MNLSNVSAMSISVPIEFLPEKIKDIQSLNFEIERLDPTIDDRIRIVAKLLSEGKPIQNSEQIDMLLQDLMLRIQAKRDLRKDPYVW